MRIIQAPGREKGEEGGSKDLSDLFSRRSTLWKSTLLELEVLDFGFIDSSFQLVVSPSPALATRKLHMGPLRLHASLRYTPH